MNNCIGRFWQTSQDIGLMMVVTSPLGENYVGACLCLLSLNRILDVFCVTLFELLVVQGEKEQVEHN